MQYSPGARLLAGVRESRREGERRRAERKKGSLGFVQRGVVRNMSVDEDSTGDRRREATSGKKVGR